MLNSIVKKILTIIIGIIIVSLLIYIVLFGPSRGIFRNIKPGKPVAYTLYKDIIQWKC